MFSVTLSCDVSEISETHCPAALAASEAGPELDERESPELSDLLNVAVGRGWIIERYDEHPIHLCPSCAPRWREFCAARDRTASPLETAPGV